MIVSLKIHKMQFKRISNIQDAHLGACSLMTRVRGTLMGWVNLNK